MVLATLHWLRCPAPSQVDQQLKFGCLLDGKVAWLGATQNLIGALAAIWRPSSAILKVSGGEYAAPWTPVTFAPGWARLVMKPIRQPFLILIDAPFIQIVAP